MTDGRSQVFVVELNDDFGPRRRPELPNLFIGITTQDPARRFAQLQASSKSRHVIRGYGTQLRTDLTADLSRTTPTKAKRQKRRLAKALTRQGYTVNGDTRVWNLYVIELRSRGESTSTALYVGETTLSPEERFQQHIDRATTKNGHRLYSPTVADRGIRLLPDLYETEPVLYSREDAETAETALGRRLTRQGYSVTGPHKKKPRRKPTRPTAG